jgi:hypothetical protein
MSVLLVLGALTLATLCIFLKKLPKVRAVAAFIAGLGFAFGAVGGLIDHLLAAVFHLLVGVSDKVGTAAFGVGISTIVAGALAFVFIHDLMPKHAAKMRTAIIGFALPLFAVAAGGAAGQLASSVHQGIVQASPYAAIIQAAASHHLGV